MTFTRCDTQKSITAYFEEEYEDLLDILKVESPPETATFKPEYSLIPARTKPIKLTKKSTMTTTTSTIITTTMSTTSNTSENTKPSIQVIMNQVNLFLETGTNFLARIKRIC